MFPLEDSSPLTFSDTMITLYTVLSARPLLTAIEIVPPLPSPTVGMMGPRVRGVAWLDADASIRYKLKQLTSPPPCMKNTEHVINNIDDLEPDHQSTKFNSMPNFPAIRYMTALTATLHVM